MSNWRLHSANKIVERRTSNAEHAAESGVAIIVTLIILAMLTILLVAFVSNVSTERQASSAFSNQMRARLAAQAAVEQAIFQISQGTATNNNYVTYVTNIYMGGGVTNPQTYFINRGTTIVGLATNFLSLPSTSSSNDFNQQGFIFPSSVVSNLWVPWVYLVNGSFTNTPAQANTVSNKALTRIAWWIDDESSKINVNYNGNTNGTSPLFSHVRTNVFDASSINLQGLPYVGSADAQNIVSSRLPPYETLPTLMEVGGSLTYSNLFVNSSGLAPFATVYSPDYEVQTNGSPRVNINAIVATNNLLYPTDVTRAYAVTNIYNAIDAVYPSYKAKYIRTSPLDAAGQIGLSNICANIVDYIDTNIWPSDANSGDYSGNSYFGRKKVPYLNEVKIETYATNWTLPGSLGNYTNVLVLSNNYYVELFNLYNASFAPSTTIQFDYPTISWSSVGATPLNGTSISGSRKSVSFSGPVSAFNSSSSGGIAVITNSLGTANFTNTYAIPNPYTITINQMPFGSTNTYYLASPNHRLDYAVVPLVTPLTGIVGTDNVGVYAVVSNSVSAIDPRWNHTTNDWVQVSPETLGTHQAAWRPDLLGDNNNITDLGNDGGYPFAGTNMLMVGELGNIAVPGTVSTKTILPLSTNATLTSPYFRTLKLYGDGYSEAGALYPDGVLLDLFTVTNGGAMINGKININTQRDQLLNGNYGALQGLLLSVSNYYLNSSSIGINSTLAQTMATDIMVHVPYFHIGQLGGNASSLSSQSTQTTDARREAVIRALSNIITIRGNVFTIYGKGQSVSIVHGATNVLGEAYIQSIVERIPQFNGVVVTGQTFKVKYHRFLTE